MVWTNWTGNVKWTPEAVATPASLDELVSVVTKAKKLRVVGSAHSFNAQMATEHTLLDLRNLGRFLDIDVERRRVRVEAGVPLHVLYPALDAIGLALPAIGGITTQSAAGAVSTGTHGSGLSLATVSSSVLAVTLVTADGRVLEIDSGELLAAARLSLGALGVVYAVTLQCVPRTNMDKRSWIGTLEEALSPALRENNLHYELDWYPFGDKAQMTTTNPTTAPATKWVQEREWLNDVVLVDGVFGTLERIGAAFPRIMPYFLQVPALLSGSTPSSQVDTWWRSLTGTPSTFRAFDVEYSIPIDRTEEGVAALVRIVNEESKSKPAYFANLPANIRFTGKDADVMLSGVSDGPRCYIDIPSFTGAPSPDRFFKKLEDALYPMGARPHWGKQFYRNPTSQFPRFADFDRLRKELDPEGKFVNPWLETLLSGGPFDGR